MRKTVSQAIKTYNMVQPDDCIVVGLSGGADSVALLHVLLQLKARLAISEIVAVHVNHGLRDEAASDENFVRDLCAHLNIPLQVCHADVSGFAMQEGIGIEEAGRILRYKYFNNAVVNPESTQVPPIKIATGHHQNDNTETIILNLARGSGLQGLCGIPPVNDNIIRPLINVSRAEIEQYLLEHGLKYVTDASNYSNEYARNRVRNIVLPTLETALNPNVIQTIAKNAMLFQEDNDLLEDIADQAFANCITTGVQNQIAINIQTLKTLPTPIARRVILRAVKDQAKKLPGQGEKRAQAHAIHQNDSFTQAHINSIMALACKKPGSQAHIPGLVAYNEYSHITITKPAIFPKLNTYQLTFQTPTHIPELNLTISLSKNPPDKPSKNTNILCTKRLNYGNVNEALFLRARRPGDKIVLGSADKPITKKLQDYFTDTKTPRHLRDCIPVLACGSDILWIFDKHNKTSTKYHPTTDNVWVTLWRNFDA